MRATNVLAPLVVLAVVAGCKKDVDKEHMDAMSEWSTKMCKCKDSDDAKKCAKKLRAAKPDYGAGSKVPADVFTAPSMEAFEKLSYPGEKCWQQINAD